jgi:hypothetical protein
VGLEATSQESFLLSLILVGGSKPSLILYLNYVSLMLRKKIAAEVKAELEIAVILKLLLGLSRRGLAIDRLVHHQNRLYNLFQMYIFETHPLILFL